MRVHSLRSRLPFAFGLATLSAHHFLTPRKSFYHHTHLLDSIPPSTPRSNSIERTAYRRPLINARIARQISGGSIAGLCAGLLVSVFSKPLAIVLGLLVLGVHALESRGLGIIPYRRFGRWLGNTHPQEVARGKGPWIVCFGVTFGLAGFGSF